MKVGIYLKRADITYVVAQELILSSSGTFLAGKHAKFSDDQENQVLINCQNQRFAIHGGDDPYGAKQYEI